MKKTVLFFIMLFSCATAILNAQETKNLYYSKGYLGNVAVGGTIGLSNDFGSRATLFTSHGYSFGNGAFVGLGAGVIMDFAGQCTIPVFADFKYSFLNKTVSPFIDYKMGASLYNLSHASLYVSPSVGVDVGRFSFSIGYVFQDCLDKVVDGYVDNPNIDKSNGTMSAFKNHWLNFTVAVAF